MRLLASLALLAPLLLLSRELLADAPVRFSAGLQMALVKPDPPGKLQGGAPWFLRGEFRGLSLGFDREPRLGDRPLRTHFAIYDSFFVEGSVGAICGRSSCASLGDVHLRGSGGYEALVGVRGPSLSVYVGPRVAWEGWITSRYTFGTGRWPVVLRTDHAVRGTERRMISAWATPTGPFRSFGGEWCEPVAKSFWLVFSVDGSTGIADPYKDVALPAMTMTGSVAIKVGSPF